MDIDEESLAIRDGEADFDPTRDATVRIFYINYSILGNLFTVKEYECIILLFYIYISLIDFEVDCEL